MTRGKNEPWMVLPAAPVLSFIRYIDGFDPYSTEYVEQRGRLRLYCLHDYDEIIISHSKTRVSEIVSEMRLRQHREWGLARRALTFRVAGESSGNNIDIDFDQLDQCIYVILLRLNPYISCASVLQAEKRVADFIRQQSDEVHKDFSKEDVKAKATMPNPKWIVTHTLAQGEIILFYSSSLIVCESMVSRLERAKVTTESRFSPFAAMGVWPCCRLNETEPGRLFEVPQNPTNCGRGSLGVAGLMVTGLCARQNPDGVVCSSALNKAACEAIQGKDGKKRRVLRGRCDHQIGWESRPGLNLFNGIRELRHTCKERTCSMGIVREVTAVEGAPVFRSGQVSIASSNGQQEGLLVDLKDMRGEPGYDLLSDHLDRMRSDLIRHCSDPKCIAEYKDISAFVGRIRGALDQYEKAQRGEGVVRIHRERYPTENQAEANRLAWADLQSSIRVLARSFERALQERLREDLLSPPTNHVPALFGASGFSRLAPFGRLVFNQLIERTSEGPSDYLIVVGPHTDGRHDGVFRIVNAPIHSLLQPYLYLELVHEVGHALFDRGYAKLQTAIRAAGDSLKEGGQSEVERSAGQELLNRASYKLTPKGRKALEFCEECFADVFCYIWGYKGDLVAYTQGWLEHFTNVLAHTRHVETLEYFRGATQLGDMLHDKALEYFWRLTNVSAMAFYKNWFKSDEMGPEGDVLLTLHAAARFVRQMVEKSETDVPWAHTEFLKVSDKVDAVLAKQGELTKDTFEQAVDAYATFILTQELLQSLVDRDRLDRHLNKDLGKAEFECFSRGEVPWQSVPELYSTLRFLRKDDRFNVVMAALLSAAQTENIASFEREQAVRTAIAPQAVT